jgi:hypothetical protein
MVIKAFTRAPWGDRPHAYTTWYEPFDDRKDLDRCLRFVLSRQVTSLTTPGDLRLLPAVLDAASRFEPLGQDESERIVATASNYQQLFTAA